MNTAPPSICNICLDDEDDDYENKARCQLACGHSFHTRCLLTWCMHKSTCPCCPSPKVACQHGALENHRPGDLAHLIKKQAGELDTIRKEVSECKDENLALAVQLHEYSASDSERYRRLIIESFIPAGAAMPPNMAMFDNYSDSL